MNTQAASEPEAAFLFYVQLHQLKTTLLKTSLAHTGLLYFLLILD